MIFFFCLTCEKKEHEFVSWKRNFPLKCVQSCLGLVGWLAMFRNPEACVYVQTIDLCIDTPTKIHETPTPTTTTTISHFSQRLHIHTIYIVLYRNIDVYCIGTGKSVAEQFPKMWMAKNILFNVFEFRFSVFPSQKKNIAKLRNK